MTDPNVPGGAGLPEGQAAPANTDEPAPDGATQPAQDSASAWSTGEPASEPAAPTGDSGAGFGMPTGGGFGAPAPADVGDPTGTPPAAPAAPSESPWGAPSAPAAAPPAGGWTPGTPLQPASRPGGSRLRPIIIGVVIVAVVVGAVVINMFGGKPVTDLQVGDCFDVPTLASESDTVDTVQHHPCTQSHTGEVIFVGDFTGGTDAYPAVSDFDAFARNTCGPVFQTYVGTGLDSSPDLSIGYFYPLEDGWSSGSRSVTCYAERTDSSSMTSSVKDSEGPAPGASPSP
jgi:Septum formation